MCVEVLFCTQVVTSGGYCERKRPLVHPRGGRRREMCAEKGSSAHGRRFCEADGGKTARLRTQESVGQRRRVRGDAFLHTRDGSRLQLWAPRVGFAYRRGLQVAVVNGNGLQCTREVVLRGCWGQSD